MPDWTTGLPQPNFEVVLMRRFERQETRKKQFEVEDAFANYLKAQAVPHAYPISQAVDQPRFSLQGSKARLQVADSAATMVLPFESGKPTSGLMQPIMRAATEMDRFDTIFPSQQRFFCSIGLIANYPVASPEIMADILTTLHSELARPTNDTPSVFNYTFAKKVGDFEQMFELTQFAAFTVQPQPGQRVFVDFDFIEEVDIGVGIKFEVNSKPIRDRPRLGLMSSLAKELKAFVNSDAAHIAGELFGRAL